MVYPPQRQESAKYGQFFKPIDVLMEWSYSNGKVQSWIEEETCTDKQILDKRALRNMSDEDSTNRMGMMTNFDLLQNGNIFTLGLSGLSTAMLNEKHLREQLREQLRGGCLC